MSEHQGLPPLLEHPHQCQPDHAVAIFDVRALLLEFLARELVPERDVLEDELSPVLRGELEESDEESCVGHPPIIDFESRRPT